MIHSINSTKRQNFKTQTNSPGQNNIGGHSISDA